MDGPFLKFFLWFPKLTNCNLTFCYKTFKYVLMVKLGGNLGHFSPENLSEYGVWVMYMGILGKNWEFVNWSVQVGCLSVPGRTSPSCLDQSPRNFWWWSGSMSGTFISGTGQIGQGTGEKRAGNSNFGRFTLKEDCCFGQCFGLVWFPGDAPCNLVVPGGH